MKWYSETWQKKGDNFLIEIKHWKGKGYNPDIKEHPIVNRWNVYAYIYPSHPVFKEIKDDGVLFDHDLSDLFHWGPSYHDWKYNKDGEITCKTIGSDYQHLHDNYENTTNIEHTPTIRDAERLFKYLSPKEHRAPNRERE